MNLVGKLGISALGVNKKMKLVQFKISGANEIRLGLLKNCEVVDLNSSDKSIPHCMVEFLNQENALEKIKR